VSENGSISLRERLEREAARRDDPGELSPERPDPLLVAREQEDERAILLCALFGYGSAAQIVKFLRSLDFSLLDAGEERIRTHLAGRRYRFQTSEDVARAFLMLGRLGRGDLESLFLRGYEKNRSVLEGVAELLRRFHALDPLESYGLRFLFGTVPASPNPPSAYKRWMMFLRWMVRKDALDLGRWRGVSRSDLVVPLDTHTFRVGHRLGLLGRKSCDWKAALELTESLKRFDPEDPVRFDFALYRIGQENLSL
jgi:uncharacterized protein (TIGR02757 family)